MSSVVLARRRGHQAFATKGGLRPWQDGPLTNRSSSLSRSLPRHHLHRFFRASSTLASSSSSSSSIARSASLTRWSATTRSSMPLPRAWLSSTSAVHARRPAGVRRVPAQQPSSSSSSTAAAATAAEAEGDDREREGEEEEGEDDLDYDDADDYEDEDDDDIDGDDGDDEEEEDEDLEHDAEEEAMESEGDEEEAEERAEKKSGEQQAQEGEQDTSWLTARRLKREYANLKPYRLGMVALPATLKKRIANLLKKMGKKGLRQTAGQLSERLRGRTRMEPGKPKTAIPEPVVYKREEAMAYVAHRLPGVYACTFRVMNEIKTRRPDWNPKSLMDFGSGPGTALWSATEVWPGLENLLAVEPSEAMIDMARELCKDKPAQWKRLLPTDPNERYDIVIASYVLSELPNEEERIAKVTSLWNHTRRGGILILVEPGTPVGFHMIRLARSTVLGDLSRGLPNVLAPRIPVQIQAKVNTSINWEDEKFSYVVLTKGNLLVDKDESFDRVMITPQKRGRHVIVKTCAQSGQLETRILSKSDGPIYKEGRKAAWGDGFTFPDDTSKRDLDQHVRPKTFKYRSLAKAGTSPSSRGFKGPRSSSSSSSAAATPAKEKTSS